MLLVTRLLASSGAGVACFKRAGVGSNIILECNTLTMNSAIALMPSHSIVGSNTILECEILFKPDHHAVLLLCEWRLLLVL
jgi:hypothetical protein